MTRSDSHPQPKQPGENTCGLSTLPLAAKTPRREKIPGSWTLFLIFALWAALPCHGESRPIDAAQALARLRQSIASLPMPPDQGYRLAGRFELKATGEDIAYEAVYLHQSGYRAADFRQTDSTKSMRFGLGPQSWAASPEVTADLKSRRHNKALDPSAQWASRAPRLRAERWTAAM